MAVPFKPYFQLRTILLVSQFQRWFPCWVRDITVICWGTCSTFHCIHSDRKNRKRNCNSCNIMLPYTFHKVITANTNVIELRISKILSLHGNVPRFPLPLLALLTCLVQPLVDFWETKKRCLFTSVFVPSHRIRAIKNTATLYHFSTIRFNVSAYISMYLFMYYMYH